MPVPIRVLYHWTNKKNLFSIKALGLQPKFATGEAEVVWGVSADRIDWALDHAASRQRWAEQDMVLLRCDVTRLPIYRSCWREVFYTPERIAPECIQVVTSNGDKIMLVDYGSSHVAG